MYVHRSPAYFSWLWGLVIGVVVLLVPLSATANNIDVAFSPNGGGEELIIQTINSAKTTLCMATYSFTSKAIAGAVLNARLRGVNVRVVSDYKANTSHYTAVNYLNNHGVAIRLNRHYAIMHNKFIVVDNQTVETGSYNYSSAAEKKNAENVIVIWNNPKLAAKYASECERLFKEAV
ncbi:MAG: hypothetical protein QG673_762 [Pseudomonadota bacterium]|nr:hypothetical protein [Pseudomonadota bacterium]